MTHLYEQVKRRRKFRKSPTEEYVPANSVPAMHRICGNVLESGNVPPPAGK